MEVDSSQWIVLIILLVVQALLTAARTSIIHVRRLRPKPKDNEHPLFPSALERLIDDAHRFRSTSYTAATMVNVLIATIAVTSYWRPLQELLPVGRPAAAILSASIIILVLLILIVLFGEQVPSLLASQHSESFARVLAGPFTIMAVVLSPLVSLSLIVSRIVAGLLGEVPDANAPLVTEEDIKSLVDVGEEEGVIEEEEKEMIFSIFELGDTLVRQVMVPRIDIVAVEVNSSLSDALDVAMQAGHSRIPVYEGHIDNIVGILHVKDLLPYFRSGRSDVPLRNILRPAYFIPETKTVSQLLPDLQQRKVHLAIVVDEYGGTAGLVTIEDLLEEIVGEIQDEYDSEEPIYQIIGDDEYILNARIDLDELQKLLGIELEAEGADTLAGFIYHMLGRVPSAGDVVHYNGAQFIVMSVEGRRIQKVRIVLDRSVLSPARVDDEDTEVPYGPDEENLS